MSSAQNKGAQTNMKQKNLMGWFTPGGTTSGASGASKNSDSDEGGLKGGKARRTPDRAPSVIVIEDSPPTSDPIDVDMLSSEEENYRQSMISHKVSKKTSKRKVVEDDSDEDMPARRVTRAAAKKQRTLDVPSDDEDEHEDGAASMKPTRQRLSRFRKSPIKKRGKGRSRSRASDDDDFIVSDSHDSSSSGSSRSSWRVSRRDDFPEPTDTSDSDIAPKMASKAKKATAKRPAANRVARGARSGSTSLTVAEQPSKNNKNGKKDKEDPFEFLVDIKDNDGIRPSEPGYDPRTLYIPAKAWKTFTPFEKQFWEIKQNHFDTILFFQKGKSFELYENDARIGHQEFDLEFTQRAKMSMVRIPETSFNMWASKFLAKGYKVGRVDQAETALGAEMRLAADKSTGKKKLMHDKADKIVHRELNKVYTSGTLVDAELLTDEEARHIVSIRELSPESGSDEESRFGLCVLDCSTCEFNLATFEDDVCLTRLETALRQLRVKELVFNKGNLTVNTSRLLKAALPDSCLWTSLRDSERFDFRQTKIELDKMFGSTYDDAMDENANMPAAIASMLGDREAVEALGAMIWYLRQLNIDKDIVSMKNFNIYDPMKQGEGLVLDGQTLAHLGILLNDEGTDEGTLLKLLGRCITPSGKRLFRIWLCMPLCELSAINDRLDAVQELLDHPSFELEFNNATKRLPDLERVVSRIHAKSCKVKEFIRVLKSFEKLSQGLTGMSETAADFGLKIISGLLRTAPDLMHHVKNVRSMYMVGDNDDKLIPIFGEDKDYDEVMDVIANLESQLDDELQKLEHQVGTNLEYWHSAQGTKDIYVVQVKASFKNIPKTWNKSGATKAFTRWKIPALAPTIRSLKEAREHRNTLVKNFKQRVFAEFDADRAVWLRAVRVLAELDCLFSLAKSSAVLDEPVCRPELVEGDAAFVDFEELRHPALCVSKGLDGDFISNDVKLGGDVGRIILLTGPNMGGKSTVMRMTATGVIMAQLGMMVPAKRARLCPVDNILTRMGAYDNMFSNSSTFKVEIDESCKILREATPKSLVIIDELGRGTSTYDGMAIAGSVLHELATRTLALAFFATHYGSLTDDFAHVPAIRNMHMSTFVDEDKCELVFLHKLVQGVAVSSFGTHVARLAGVPEPVVVRADAVSAGRVQQFAERMAGRRQTAASRLPITAQADFAYLWRLAKGEQELPEDNVRKQEVLEGIMSAMRGLVWKA